MTDPTTDTATNTATEAQDATVLTLPRPSGMPIPHRDDRDWITSAELVHEARISYRQLDYWTRTGLLVPLEAAMPGSGYLRRWDQHQHDRAVAIRLLLDAGMSLQVIRQVVDQVVADGTVRLGAVTITVHQAGAAS